MNYQYHPFHMVEPSFYPLLYGMGTLASTFAVLQVVCEESYEIGWNLDTYLNVLSVLFYTYVFYEWITDVCFEGAWYGCHTWYAQVLFRMGWFFFVLSEVMIFFSFFWTFFYYALSPNVSMGMQWVPSTFPLINPFELPLLNTGVLLGSGVTATMSHYYFLMNYYKKAGSYMTLTIVLGLYFLLLQMTEYYLAGFDWSDSAYGGIFFMTTLMHGAHVSGGATSLFIARWRMTHHGWSELIAWDKISQDIKNLFNCYISPQQLFDLYKFPSQFSYYSHLNLELGIWYWHFVDVVWLFLYSSYYCWMYWK